MNGGIMNIRVIAVGKIKENWLKQGIAEYTGRIARYCTVEICEIPDQPESGDSGKDLNIEAGRIMSKIKVGDHVVVLDINGDSLDSVRLARKMENWMEKGGASVTFVIGGSNGLSGEILKRADAVLSFSMMTFPHRLMRLILLEQIYRSFSIINNEKYHK